MNIPPLTIFQRLKLRLFGYVKVGTIQQEGWTQSLPLYIFQCRKHDLFYDYWHGFTSFGSRHSFIKWTIGGWLWVDCPTCVKEAK